MTVTRVRKICEPAALALVLVLFFSNVHRAWTQSITTDEAFTYNEFLAGAPAKLFNHYDAAHHVLHTMLCKISIWLFGLSEFTLRIPSLLGGLLYLLTAFRLSRFLFGRGWLMLLSVGLLSLNPFLLDYLSLARGYGLAVALFLWSFYQLAQYFSGYYVPGIPLSGYTLVYKAAIGLALSVTANLTLLFPATALAVLFLAIVLTDGLRCGERKLAARQFWFAVDSFIVPGIALAFILLILPVLKAHRDNFYLGTATLAEAVHSIILPSLYHHPIGRPWHGALAGSMLWFLEKVFVPSVAGLGFLGCAAVTIRWFRRRSFHAIEKTGQFLFLGGGAMLGALALLVMAHRGFGILYPFARTGLYFVPLFILTTLGLWKQVESSRIASVVLRLPLLLFGAAWLLLFVLQFPASYYPQWSQDAGTKKIVNLIRERHAGMRQGKIRVGVSWTLEPGINFYRRMYGLDWMEPVTREMPSDTADYYVLLPPDAALAGTLHLSKLYEDHIAQAILGVPSSPPQPPPGEGSRKNF